MIKPLDDLSHAQVFVHEPLIDGADDFRFVFINHQVAGAALAFGNVAIAIRRFAAELVAGAEFLLPASAKAVLQQRAFVFRHRPLDLKQ